MLTPYHVVEGATKVYVYLPGRGGSYADIHAADSRHDLAVLKLINPPDKLTAIKFADVRLDNRNGQRPTVAPGKLVVLMANSYIPGFALDKPSAALGSLTNVRHRTNSGATGKEKSDSYYYFGSLLEHDAAAQRLGQRGGPAEPRRGDGGADHDGRDGGRRLRPPHTTRSRPTRASAA